MPRIISGVSHNARAGVKNVAAGVLCAAGVPTRARRRHRDRLAILMYHGIEPEALIPPCWHVLGAAMFRRQLDYVRKHFQVLALDEALDRMSAGTLPPRAVAITFDDGTRNLATHAAPVLRDLGLPAAVFLTTGPMGTEDTLWPDRLWLAFARGSATAIDLSALGLGNRSLASVADRGDSYAATVSRLKDFPDHQRIALLENIFDQLNDTRPGDAGPFQLLSWPEARAMAGDGLITLYPHSVTHPILARCADEKVEHEITDSCAAIERETGRIPAVFAYPNGRPQDFDARAKAALERRGVQWALATTPGFAHRGSDPMALPRFGVGCDTSFAEFRMLLAGGLPSLAR